MASRAHKIGRAIAFAVMAVIFLLACVDSIRIMEEQRGPRFEYPAPPPWWIDPPAADDGEG